MPEPTNSTQGDDAAGDPDHKGGTIRNYVGAVGATCKELGHQSPSACDEVWRLIHHYEEEDGHASSSAFDMATDLTRLYGACWSMPRWAFMKMLMVWTMGEIKCSTSTTIESCDATRAQLNYCKIKISFLTSRIFIECYCPIIPLHVIGFLTLDRL